MLRRAFLLSVFVAVITAVASFASAVDLSTGFVLVDSNGSIIAPSSANTYNIPLGMDFKVRLQATLTNPNYTDNFRSDPALRNVPLGLHLVAGDITSSIGGVVSPVEIPNGNPYVPLSTWDGFESLGPLSAPSFTNLLPKDGFLYPAGAGVSDMSRSLNNTSQLPLYQVGVNGTADLFQGNYSATALGTTDLSFLATSLMVYQEDFLDSSSALKTKYVYYQYNEPSLNGGYHGHTPLTINVVSSETIAPEAVPEPSSMLLVGAGLCGLALLARGKRSSSQDF